MFRETMFLRSWSFRYVPALFFVRPSVVELTDERSVIKIPLRRRTANHLHSMYFGVLCAGADCAGGLLAMRHIGKQRISLIFKDFKGEFLKRAEADVLFTCPDGAAVADLVRRVSESGERDHRTLHVVATAPAALGDEPVARFELTLSLKKS